MIRVRYDSSVLRWLVGTTSKLVVGLNVQMVDLPQKGHFLRREGEHVVRLVVYPRPTYVPCQATAVPPERVEHGIAALPQIFHASHHLETGQALASLVQMRHGDATCRYVHSVSEQPRLVIV